ncbi:MAG: Monosaccharide-transporting ATPase [Frondihabitans sp.]|nr:Monosaccharide-transporting ATPase [Frondihabitans sp.]
MQTPSSALAVDLRGITMRFGEQWALDGVDLAVRPSTVHGLLGENGSGKSTLIKILAGVYAPDAGQLTVRGHNVPLPLTTAVGAASGFQFVHQDLGLIPSLTVAENLLLGQVATGGTGPLLSDRGLRRTTSRVLDKYSLPLDPRAAVADLRPVERALLAIVRAVEAMTGDVSGDSGLLVLDEPTVFLPRHDVEEVFALVRRLAAVGNAVLLVSHDLDEVLEVTDEVTVLRDGRVAGTAITQELDRSRLVEMIVGRAVDFSGRSTELATPANTIALASHDLAGGTLRGIDLELRAGEIVGLTGLAGSGFDEVPYLLSGARTASRGTVSITGAPPLDASTITPSTSRGSGVGLLPADRRNTAGIATLDVVDNVTMLTLGSYRRWRGIDRRAMRRSTAQLMEAFDVRPRDPDHAFGTLSGGNQQKALLAKWLSMSPSVLLIDEPTQGVDIGARRQIFDDLRRAADDGTAVLVSSTDHEQLAALCDRVVVLQRGRISSQLSGTALTKTRISEACMAIQPDGAAAAFEGASS